MQPVPINRLGNGFSRMALVKVETTSRLRV